MFFFRFFLSSLWVFRCVYFLDKKETCPPVPQGSRIWDYGWEAGSIYRNKLSNIDFYEFIFGDFLKWWYPTTIGFPTKNDHFGGVLGVPPF